MLNLILALNLGMFAQVASVPQIPSSSLGSISLAVPQPSHSHPHLEKTALPAALTADCGHCHEVERDLGDGLQWYHTFTDDEPGHTTCQSAQGHPIHDCENGDGGEYSYGPCEPPCPPEFAAVLARMRDLSGMTAAELERTYPRFVSYDPATRLISVRDCGGNVVKTEVID